MGWSSLGWRAACLQERGGEGAGRTCRRVCAHWLLSSRACKTPIGLCGCTRPMARVRLRSLAPGDAAERGCASGGRGSRAAATRWTRPRGAGGATASAPLPSSSRLTLVALAPRGAGARAEPGPRGRAQGRGGPGGGRDARVAAHARLAGRRGRRRRRHSRRGCALPAHRRARAARLCMGPACPAAAGRLRARDGARARFGRAAVARAGRARRARRAPFAAPVCSLNMAGLTYIRTGRAVACEPLSPLQTSPAGVS